MSPLPSYTAPLSKGQSGASSQSKLISSKCHLPGTPASLSCMVTCPHLYPHSLQGSPGLGRPGPTCAFNVIVRDALPVLHKGLQQVNAWLPLRREQRHNLSGCHRHRRPHHHHQCSSGLTLHHLLSVGGVLALGGGTRTQALKGTSNTCSPAHIRTVSYLVNNLLALLPRAPLAPSWKC